MKNKRLVALLLALSLAISIAPTSLAAPSDAATRGEVVQMLIPAADSYNPTVRKETIIQGDESGNLNEGAPVTRIEALVMLGRAFGELPAPRGDNLRMGNPAATFSDLPEWAIAEMENVLQSGIVAGTGDGKFSPNDNVTKGQMKLFINRVWALQGSNKADDFYATVNKNWLDSSKLKAGMMQTGAMSEVGDKANEQVAQIIAGAAANATAANPADNKNSPQEQKIADFYASVKDTAGRKQVGLTPIMPYITAIDNAANINELMKVRATILKETGVSIGIGFGLGADFKDSNKHILVAGMATPTLTREQYENGDESGEALRVMVSKFLRMTGETDSASAHHALELYQFEKALSAASLSVEDSSNIDNIGNVHTLAQLQAALPTIDVEATLIGDGYAKTDEILVTDMGALKVNTQYFTDEHLVLQKTIAKYGIMNSLGSLLIDDVSAAANEFSKTVYGAEGKKTIEEQAETVTQSIMNSYLGQAYVAKHFSQEAKNDVTKMVREFSEIYKNRLGKLDWMSDATKKEAMKKLDKMTYKIGYPDKWDQSLDGVAIKAPKDGGSLFENVRSIMLAQRAAQIKLQFAPVDKSAWLMKVYDVNAYYNAQANEIVFPAGILQAPFYSKNATREENLGGIGFVIAHEITHAFDNNGAKFDEKGNKADWWTEADLAAFNKKCDEVIKFYDKIEVAPGVANNGARTLSENIADLGAAACVLDAMKKIPAPDYKNLFESMANAWTMTSTKQYLQLLSNVDMHSFNKLRINRVLVNFEEFYKTYNITEKDGMYVAPENRVSIW